VRPFLDAMHSSHEFGAPKEHPEFWDRFRARVTYDPARTAFIDDSPKVLEAARRAGIDCIIAVTAPDSTRPPREPPPGFAHVGAVAEIA
jgi:FMN phosphatase YigB (HAD superfamily)